MHSSIRTRLEPWDFLPNARGPIRTSIGPEDLDPRQRDARTVLAPGDVNPALKQPRTALAPGETQGRVHHDDSLLEMHKNLTKQAERLVGQTFFGTLMRQMRNSPFKSELFSGGRGGEAFTSLYDDHMAQRMAHGAGRSLAASIVKHLEPKEVREAVAQQMHG